jgi:hypothetical protein
MLIKLNFSNSRSSEGSQKKKGQKKTTPHTGRMRWGIVR